MGDDKKPEILLVDEDRFLLGIYTRRLEECGFAVEIATSEKEALDKLEGPCPDMIVLDILIGETPGLKVLEILRKKIGEQKCLFVVLTNGGVKNAEKAKSLGADAYIIKAHNTPQEVAEELEKLYYSKR